MKTKYYFSKKMSIYSLFGLMALIVTSCGSYQNNSYYDRDGIYGSDANKVAENTNNPEVKISQDNKYTEYFGSLRDDQQEEEVFTDVENYTSYKDSTETQQRNQSAGWGSDNSDITVNVYGNNWGYNNWGWNNWGYNNWHGNYWGYNNLAWNSWYGPSWGWGFNSWCSPWGYNNWYGGYYGYGGYGWNNWYGNGYYGNYQNQNYVRANGRRGSTYNRSETYTRRGNEIISRGTTVTGTRRTDYAAPTRTSTTRNSTIRNSANSPVRSFEGTNTTRNNTNSTTRSTTTSPTRNNTSTTRSSSSTTRSSTYTPSSSSSSSTRSSSSGSSGGTRSSGGSSSRSGGSRR